MMKRKTKLVKSPQSQRKMFFCREVCIDFFRKDAAFETQIIYKKKTYMNPIGKLIDLIEDHLLVREIFVMR